MTRLSEAQIKAGLDSKTFTLIRKNLKSEPHKAPIHGFAAVIDDVAARRHDFLAPVSLYRDVVSSSLRRIPRESNIIHLHWINGMTTVKKVGLHFPNAQIVWTLHDMNPFTGGCHQALGCLRFESGCSRCPAVRVPWKGNISRRALEKREDILSHPITFVAPSKWIARQAQQSQILRNCSVEVIPNPLPVEFMKSQNRDSRASHSEKVLSVVCADLSNPMKKVADVIKAQQVCWSNGFKTRVKLIGTNVGHLGRGEGVEWIGELSNEELRHELRSSDYLVQPSGGESFGLSVIEAASQGVTPIVRAGGALQEVQTALGHGFVFEDVPDLVSIIRQISSSPVPSPEIRETLRRQSLDRFSPESVERSYRALYERDGKIT